MPHMLGAQNKDKQMKRMYLFLFNFAFSKQLRKGSTELWAKSCQIQVRFRHYVVCVVILPAPLPMVLDVIVFLLGIDLYMLPFEAWTDVSYAQISLFIYFRQRLPPKNVYYYRCPDHRKNYVMSFAFCFDREEDIYQFAYCYPYTYTRFQHYLDSLQKRNMDYFFREQLGQSVVRPVPGLGYLFRNRQSWDRDLAVGFYGMQIMNSSAFQNFSIIY